MTNLYKSLKKFTIKVLNIIYSVLICTSIIFLPINILADSRYVIKDILIEIDDTKIHNGVPGKTTKALQNNYFNLIRGEYDKHNEWLTHLSEIK